MTSRFDGAFRINFTRPDAERFAQLACGQPSTREYIHMNVFCDASKDKYDDKGGIAVILPAWVPGGASREQIEVAYPVTPLYSCELGELLAVSEALHIATKEIQQNANNLVLSARPVVVRIFNDNKDNLWYLQGEGWLHPGLIALADPVLKAVAAQSRLIKTFGVDVKLELVWIPGHHHDIRPHKTADLAYLARRLDRSYTNALNWTQREEGAVLRLLKPYLADAALRAAQHMLELRNRLPAAPVSTPTSAPAPPAITAHSNPAVHCTSKDPPRSAAANDDAHPTAQSHTSQPQFLQQPQPRTSSLPNEVAQLPDNNNNNTTTTNIGR